MRLNSTEEWIAAHSVRVFAVMAILMAVGGYMSLKALRAQERVQHDVSVIKPQITKIGRAICDQRSLENKARAARCAEQLRIGLINCRRARRCRAALLAALAPSPAQGGDAQNPSHPGQQPGPGARPGHHTLPARPGLRFLFPPIPPLLSLPIGVSLDPVAARQ